MFTMLCMLLLQDPLAGQRRESLAQLSGIRSKIGVWETKLEAPRRRPKGDNAARVKCETNTASGNLYW